MLLCRFFIASVLSWPAVSALLAPTQYANSTSAVQESTITSSASFDASSCSVDCTFTYPSRSASYWSKFVSVATVATVVVVINDSNNTTNTVTSYVESLLINGTAPTNSLPPRTDTNEAGTVTYQVQLLNGTYAAFAYPTVYYEVESAYEFNGTLPYSSGGRTTCISYDRTSLPLPTDTGPRPTGTVDPEDRFGSLYMMERLYFPDDWPTDELFTEVRQSCKGATIEGYPGAAAEVTYLTVTSTAHVSDPIATVPSTLSPQPTTLIYSQERPNPTTKTPSTVPADIDEVRVTVPSSPSARNPTLDPTLVTGVAPGTTSSPKVAPHLPSSTLVVESKGLTETDQQSAPKASAASVPTITPIGQIYPAGSVFTSGYIYETQTLVPGGPAISVLGNLISLPSEAASQTSNVPVAVVITHTDSPASSADTQSRTATVGVDTYILNGLGGSTVVIIMSPTSQVAAPGYVLGTQTLMPGGPPITVSGTKISLADGETLLVVHTGSGAQMETSGIAGFIQSNLSGSKAATTTETGLSSSAYAYVIGTQTLVPGGPVITVSGTQISLAPSGTQVIVGTDGRMETKTIAISGYIVSSLGGSALATNSGLNPSDHSTAQSSAYAYIIGTQTLVPGGPAITVSGTQVSLAPSGTEVIVGTGGQMETKIIAISGYIMSSLGGSALATTDSSLNPSDHSTAQSFIVSTAQGSAYAYIIGTQTLVPGGPAITVSGTQVSLAPSGTEVIVGTGGQMETKTMAISGYIVSSLGGSALATGSGLDPSDHSTAQSSIASTAQRSVTSTTSPSVNTALSGESSIPSSNILASTGATHPTEQVGFKALLLWAAVWCIWTFYHL
ncbi:hypothetical protein GJ744_009378 [Endocarpon pusillum]|uniref:Uncharacterized protein n=1 Tax=Endocarpon pusillum TaxID=364733 RepID=A0A8H7AK17_9EURO|nr:hypothetical protein GJ744_009378 [Endocarpon pusillum]